MDVDDKIRRLLEDGRFAVSRRHIEEERPWRGILVVHVHQVLENGTLLDIGAETRGGGERT